MNKNDYLDREKALTNAQKKFDKVIRLGNFDLF